MQLIQNEQLLMVAAVHLLQLRKNEDVTSIILIRDKMLSCDKDNSK